MPNSRLNQYTSNLYNYIVSPSYRKSVNQRATGLSNIIPLDQAIRLSTRDPRTPISTDVFQRLILETDNPTQGDQFSEYDDLASVRPAVQRTLQVFNEVVSPR